MTEPSEMLAAFALKPLREQLDILVTEVAKGSPPGEWTPILCRSLPATTDHRTDGAAHAGDQRANRPPDPV
jgi:hypothetical protein